MEIEYQCTAEDFIEFNLFHAANSRSIQGRVLFGRIVVSLLTLLLPIGIFTIIYGEFRLYYLIASTLGGIFIFAIYPSLYRESVTRLTTKMLKEGQKNEFLKKQYLSLSSEGIFGKSESGESKINWSSIEKVAQGKNHIFIYLSSVNAIVIPKRAFPSDKFRQEFLDYINAQYSQINR